MRWRTERPRPCASAARSGQTRLNRGAVLNLEQGPSGTQTDPNRGHARLRLVVYILALTESGENEARSERESECHRSDSGCFRLVCFVLVVRRHRGTVLAVSALFGSVGECRSCRKEDIRGCLCCSGLSHNTTLVRVAVSTLLSLGDRSCIVASAAFASLELNGTRAPSGSGVIWIDGGLSFGWKLLCEGRQSREEIS